MANGPHSSLRDEAQPWLLGFFGVLLGFLLLPKTVKFVFRKFLLGVIGEVVTVVLTGLLAEKAVDALAHDHDDARRPSHEEAAPGRRR